MIQLFIIFFLAASALKIFSQQVKIVEVIIELDGEIVVRANKKFEMPIQDLKEIRSQIDSDDESEPFNKTNKPLNYQLRFLVKNNLIWSSSEKDFFTKIHSVQKFPVDNGNDFWELALRVCNGYLELALLPDAYLNGFSTNTDQAECSKYILSRFPLYIVDAIPYGHLNINNSSSSEGKTHRRLNLYSMLGTLEKRTKTILNRHNFKKDENMNDPDFLRIFQYFGYECYVDDWMTVRIGKIE